MLIIIYWIVWPELKRLKLSKNYFCSTFMTEKEKNDDKIVNNFVFTILTTNCLKNFILVPLMLNLNILFKYYSNLIALCVIVLSFRKGF